eukprot:925518-Amphidinium_carterae.1
MADGGGAAFPGNDSATMGSYRRRVGSKGERPRREGGTAEGMPFFHMGAGILEEASGYPGE